MYGKKHTKEWLEKASERMRGGNNPIAKKVVCIETDITYNSISEAGQQTNIKSGRIIDTCRGRQKTAGGYHWEYCDQKKRRGEI